MKSLRFVAVITFLILALASCKSSRTPVANQTPASTAPAPIATTAASSVFKIQESGIQFEVPAGWQAEKSDEQYVVTIPDNSVSLVFMPVDDQAAAEKAVADFKKKLQNAKPNGAAKKELRNDLNVEREQGTAQMNGTQQRWAIEIVSSEKPVVVYSQVNQNARAARSNEAESITKSIKKTG